MNDGVEGGSKYARWEHERRWVLRAVPTDVEAPRRIVDLYVPGTTLRLRRVSTAEGDIYKLTQKVRAVESDPSSTAVTTMYLSESGHQIVAAAFTDARLLVKIRWTHRESGLTFAVDEFEGRLSGLVLAELETAEPDLPVRAPRGAIADVTHDDRFSGAALASSTASDVREVLAEGIGG